MRHPGQKVEIYLLPNGRLEVRAADWPAIEARLAMLAAGGDFADGVIAFESRRLDGVVFTQLRPHGGRIDCSDRRRDAKKAGRWR